MNAALQRYLEEVERRLTERPPEERASILTGLREHIRELLVVHNGNVDAVLAALDDPSAYGTLPADAPPIRHARPWMLIALLSLALNVVGAWFLLGQDRATDTNSFGNIQQPATELILQKIEQLDFAPNRAALIALEFSEKPDARVLENYLELTDGDGQLDYSVVSSTDSNRVVIRTREIAGNGVSILLAKGFPALNSNVVLENPVTKKLSVTSNLQIAEISVKAPAFEEISIVVSSTLEVDASTANKFISVDPAVRFTIQPRESWYDNKILLNGDFTPETLYTLRFKKGLRAKSGAALTQDVVRRIQIPMRSPALAFPTSGQYLSPQGNLHIPLSAMNLSEVELSAARVLPQNLVQFIGRETDLLPDYYGDPEELLTQRGPTRTNLLVGAANHEIKTRVSLRDLVEGEPIGAFFVTAKSKKITAKQLVVATDIGLSARLSQGTLFVWVNSLATARPLQGVEVVAYGANNAELVRGKTSDDGTLSLPMGSGGTKPAVLIASTGNDLSYLDLVSTEVTPADTQRSAAYLADGYEAFVFTDRGVYRPNETVHVKAILRDKELNPPKSFPIRFRAIRPDGQLFREWPLLLDEWGAAETNFVAKDFLPTGLYRLQVLLPTDGEPLGSTTVAVEEFVPPQIRVSLDSPTAPLPASAPFTFAVKSQHLFGRPAAGLAVSGRAQFEAVAFTPDGWAGFVFGDREKKFDPIFSELGSGHLDENGVGQFSVSPSSAWSPPARVKATLGATVREAGGRTVSAYGSALVDVYPFYIGLRFETDGAVNPSKEQRARVAAVLPDGAPAFTNGALKWTISTISGAYVMKRDSNKRFSFLYQETVTPVHEGVLVVGATAADLVFPAESSGEYLLVVSDPASGVSASKRFTVISPNDPWQRVGRERPDTIELKCERERYAPGDTAKVLVKPPFAGPALLTIETDHILEHRLVELDGNATELAIPVKADYAPNVYVTLTVLRPAVAERTWSAHRAVGAIALRVQPTQRRLNIALDAPGTNRPQAQLNARIRVTDESGNPVRASVNVMAVDEGICALTGFNTPDPLSFFLAQRALGVSWFDLYSLLMPVMEDEINRTTSHMPGGAAASLLRRLNPIRTQRFKPVALWSAPLLTDENGEATATFNVPEFTGELRIMAVANDRQRLGSAERAVKIKRPLVVETTLPRFLAPGDTSSITIQIFNETGADQSVQLRVTSGGPLSIDAPDKTFQLAANKTRTETITLRADDAPGRGLCTVDVTAGSERYSETVELAVRPAWPEQSMSEVGSLSAGKSHSFGGNANLLPGTEENVIWSGGAPSIQLGQAVNQLVGYPYGCLEQTVSRAIPMLYLPELANRLLPKSMNPEEVASFIDSAVLRVLSMQQPQGGFGMWPRVSSTWTWGSVYTAHFLVEARRAGHEVPSSSLDAALQYLRTQLDRPLNNTVDEAWRTDMEERAYAARVLALAGQPVPGWNARLAELYPALTPAARIHTAVALSLSGDPRQGNERLKQVTNDGVEGVEDLSWLLLASLDLDPKADVVADLARRIEAARTNGDWGATTPNALALLALGRYATLVPAEQKPFVARMEERGVSTAIEPHGSTWTNTGPFTLVNEGPGALYYSLRQRGVPKRQKLVLRDNGIVVRRQWLDLKGNAVAQGVAKQGELVIVKITVSVDAKRADNLIIEDLLPAGFEIENPALATAERFAWMKGDEKWILHREVRDDRLLLFSGAFSDEQTFFYTMRAVTPGRFAQPPITASAMYAPDLRSVAGAGEVTVIP